MRKAFLFLVVLSSSALSAYVPGTPGAAWTKEEVLAVKAGLFDFYQTGLNGQFPTNRPFIDSEGRKDKPVSRPSCGWASPMKKGAWPRRPTLPWEPLTLVTTGVATMRPRCSDSPFTTASSTMMAPGAVTAASTGQGWAHFLNLLQTRGSTRMLASPTIMASGTRWRSLRPCTRSNPFPDGRQPWPNHSESPARVGLTSGHLLGLWLWSMA